MNGIYRIPGNLDAIADTLGRLAMTPAERTKLAGITLADLMFKSIYANGSGENNPNAVDCALHALYAGAANNAENLNGYQASSIAMTDIVVATRSDIAKIASAFLNIIAGANMSVTINANDEVVIATVPSPSFSGTMSAENIIASGSISTPSYVKALDGVLCGPYINNVAQASYVISTVSPNMLTINGYTGGMATVSFYDTVARRQYGLFNRTGSARFQPITSASPLTISSRGIILPGGARTAYIESTQTASAVMVWIDSSNQAYILWKTGQWKDDTGTVIP